MKDLKQSNTKVFITHTKNFSNMDGPRDCHVEWSKSNENKFHIILVEYLLIRRIFKKGANELIYKIIVTDVGNKLMVTRGGWW